MLAVANRRWSSILNTSFSESWTRVRDEGRELLRAIRPDIFEQDRELVSSDPSDGVTGSKRLGDPGRGQDQEAITHGVAEAVVHEFEPVDVQEEDGEGQGRVALVVPQGVVQAVHEECPVGKPGQRIVERVVPQLTLRPPALGDIGQRPRHPRRLPVRGVADGQATGKHPPPRAVGVLHAVLRLHVRGLSGQMAGDRLAQPGDVVRMDELEPGVRRVVRGRLGLAEEGTPAGREVHPVGLEVPVPDAIVDGAGGKGIALLCAGQLPEGLVVADGVADRALERQRVELLLQEEVRHADARCLQIDLVVGLAGQHDDRCGWPTRKSRAHQVEAGVLTEAVVDQIDTVALFAHDRLRCLEVRAPVENEAGSVLLAKQVTRDQVVILVILDEEDRHRADVVHSRGVLPLGSSTNSNQ